MRNNVAMRVRISIGFSSPKLIIGLAFRGLDSPGAGVELEQELTFVSVAGMSQG
jgi:hypothetical protein